MVQMQLEALDGVQGGRPVGDRRPTRSTGSAAKEAAKRPGARRRCESTCKSSKRGGREGRTARRRRRLVQRAGYGGGRYGLLKRYSTAADLRGTKCSVSGRREGDGHEAATRRTRCRPRSGAPRGSSGRRRSCGRGRGTGGQRSRARSDGDGMGASNVPHALQLRELVGKALVRRPRVCRRGRRAAHAREPPEAAAAHHGLHLRHLLGRRHRHATEEARTGRITGTSSGTGTGRSGQAEHVEGVGGRSRTAGGGVTSGGRRGCAKRAGLEKGVGGARVSSDAGEESQQTRSEGRTGGKAAEGPPAPPIMPRICAIWRIASGLLRKLRKLSLCIICLIWGPIADSCGLLWMICEKNEQCARTSAQDLGMGKKLGHRSSARTRGRAGLGTDGPGRAPPGSAASTPSAAGTAASPSWTSWRWGRRGCRGPCRRTGCCG